MVQIAGKYEHVKNENFVEYLKVIGIPEDKAEKVNSLKPVLDIATDGKKVSINSNAGVDSSSTTFILDAEVDEPLPLPYNVTVKSSAKLDGDTLTITSKSPDGKTGRRIYQFSDSELILTLSDDSNGPTAKRYYKRI